MAMSIQESNRPLPHSFVEVTPQKSMSPSFALPSLESHKSLERHIVAKKIHSDIPLSISSILSPPKVESNVASSPLHSQQDAKALKKAVKQDVYLKLQKWTKELVSNPSMEKTHVKALFKEIFQSARNIPEINRIVNKLKKSDEYVDNENFERCVDLASHFSYIMQSTDKYLAITEKMVGLLNRQKAGEVIAEEEKLTPQEAHLVDSYTHDSLLEKILDNADLFSDELSIKDKNSLEGLKKAQKEWKAFKKDAFDYQSGDILFYTKEYASYKGIEKSVQSKVKKWATKGLHFHASVAFKQENIPLKESGIWQNHLETPINIGQASYLVGFRIDARKLLNQEIASEVLDYLHLDEKQLQAMLAKQATFLHGEISNNPALQFIENGFMTQLSTLKSKALPSEMQANLKEIPSGNIACSQFATYASILAINRLEGELRRLVETKIASDKKEGKPLPKALESSLENKKPWFKPLFPSVATLTPQGILKALQPYTVFVPPSPNAAAVFKAPNLQKLRVDLDSQTFRSVVKSPNS